MRVLALSLLVAVTCACQTVAQEKTQADTTVAKASAAAPSVAPTAATPFAPAALDELMIALQAAQQSKSFRAQLKSQINDEEADDLTLEFVAPNRRRIRGQNLQIIIVGEDGYLSFGGKWQRAPRDPEAKSSVFRVGSAPVFWGLAENAEARAAITIKNATPTMLEGKPATLFEYEMKNAFGKQGVCTLQTWVAKADGLPRRTEMIGSYEGRQAKAVLIWTEYNAALTIDAPVLP